MKYRKKPVVIEALLASEILACAKDEDQWRSMPDWVIHAYHDGVLLLGVEKVFIRTLEGTMHAEATDWVMRGVRGELYPCKPDIFAATYETAGESEPVTSIPQPQLPQVQEKQRLGVYDQTKGRDYGRIQPLPYPRRLSLASLEELEQGYFKARRSEEPGARQVTIPRELLGDIIAEINYLAANQEEQG